MNKLQSVRYEAAYSQLAQKLDMHIKNFDSDPNTQIRWVWELIQNAKDAPNVFKQTKIKQSLDEYHFVSSHNGDAFEISQLHSVVAQYSTKKEKNSELTKTTGKYGTGFITTYILSKIIELEGILKVEIDVDSEDENESESSDDESSNQETLSSRIKCEKQKPSKYKNNQKIHRLVRLELKNRYLEQCQAKKMKSTHIRKKRSRNLERMRNKLIYEKEMERLRIEEQIEYEDEMKLLEAQLAGLSTGGDNDFRDFENRTNFKKKEHKPKKNKKKSVFYYKKFSIPMDRSYTDRDEQLPKKIQKTQKRLTKIVLEAEYESTKNPDLTTGNYYQYQRTVDCYDTTFRYKLSEKKKFEMIQRTLINVKELMPYAFLFNDSLNYYEFVDRRKETKGGLSFAMTKGQIIEIGKNIFLFTIQVEEDYSYNQQKFTKAKIEYFVTYFLKGKAIAALPVHINGSCIQILQIDPKLPKFFKDFPLIGCSDHRWNAFINSREFYPNQKRSELMLTSYDETNSSKVQTNWEKLYECFSAVKDIYVFLSQSPNCKAGLQNLLILSSENMLTKERAEFKAHLETLVREISSTNIIPNRLKQAKFEDSRTAPKNLMFIEMASTPQEVYNKTTKEHFELSYQANRVFSFLYGDQCTLDSEYYQSFYLVLYSKSPYREFLKKQKVVNFLTINDCLNKMETLTLAQIRILIRSNYEDKLHEVYSLLQKYNQDAYLSLSKPLPFFDFKIFLSEKDDLRRLRGDSMKFNSLPAVYEELAEKLHITIRENMIHKKFSKYIKESDNRFFMDVPKLETIIIVKLRVGARIIQNKLDLDIKKNQYLLNGLDRLKTLFSFLLTFDAIKPKTVDLIRKFVDFSTAKEFTFVTNKKELRKLAKHTESTLLNQFVQGFKVFFEFLIKNTPNLKNQLVQVILIKYEEESIDFLKSLFSDELLGNALCEIPIKLSWDGIFKQEKTLKKLDKNVDYPQLLDIQIYNIGYRQSTIVKLEQQLIHPLYPRQIISKKDEIKLTTYFELYQSLRNKYDYLLYENKYQILNYISQINQKYTHGAKLTETVIQKYKAWEEKINKRLTLMYNLKNASKAFEDEDIKEFLYSLINNPSELKNAQLIYKNNGNKMYFSTVCDQLGVKRDDKKVEEKPKSK